MGNSKRKGLSGIKVLIALVVYIVVFVGYMMFVSNSTENKIVDVENFSDLEYAYQNELFGDIDIEEFVEICPVTTVITTEEKGKTVESKKHTTLRGADFDGGYVLLIDYHSANYLQFMDDDEAFVKVKKVKDYQLEDLPYGLTLNPDDYVISYQTATGQLIYKGGMFLVISTIIIAIGVSIAHKAKRQ